MILILQSNQTEQAQQYSVAENTWATQIKDEYQ